MAVRPNLKTNMRQGRDERPYPEKRTCGRVCAYEHTLMKATARTKEKSRGDIYSEKFKYEKQSGSAQTRLPW